MYIKLGGLQEKYGLKNHTAHTVNYWVQTQTGTI